MGGGSEGATGGRGRRRGGRETSREKLAELTLERGGRCGLSGHFDAGRHSLPPILLFSLPCLEMGGSARALAGKKREGKAVATDR
jgi:hypothetical protein